QKLGFRFWGGDKTWIAPERDWWEKIPPLQLDAGGYDRQISGNGIKMISPVCGETGLQIKRTVSISHDGTITLDQEMTNYGHGTVCKGIWNVTQLLRPCDVYLPTKKENIRSYHKEDPTLPDHCVVLAQEGDLTCIPCRDSQVFKFGGMIDVGQVLCLCDTPDGQVALLKIFSVDVKGRYLHRSMIEIFNSNIHGYLEVEIHAPGAKLKSGDFMSHSQEWRLKRYPRTAGPQDIYIDLISRRT
ncbi:MAG: DUF4380 domain-containing protein, partial [Candidatus Omnitrophica bacterium]|nr:DUF4380 domain-containing protein [Candidatus Omnitrophota bacterium]